MANKCHCADLEKMKIHEYIEQHGIFSASNFIQLHGETEFLELKRRDPNTTIKKEETFHFILAKELRDALVEISEACK